MSKISLAPNAAGTAIFTIESPGTSTNRTLTLPDDTGTIVTNSGNQAGSFTTLNTSGQVVFNDAGADVDFRVESDTLSHALFLDGATGNVAINTDDPNDNLHARADSDGKGITIQRNSGTSGTYGQLSFVPSTVGSSTPNLWIRGYRGSTFAANYLTFGTADTERARITSGGAFLFGGITAADAVDGLTIGKDANGCFLNSNTSASSKNHQYFQYNSSNVGIISSTTTNTTYGTSSDYRLKENIAPMTGALAKVLELNPVTYTWKIDGSAGEGFIAHELQAIVPDCVIGEKDATQLKQVEVSPAVPATYDEEGNELTPAVEAVYEEREVPVYQNVDTSFLVATLTAAIQELKAELDAAKERIAALENA